MVLVNKLAMSDKDSLDAQNLTRWMSHQTHRLAAWQSVTPSTLANAIEDAPVLYISGCGEGQFTPDLDAPIRRLVESGGVVLVQPIAGDGKFLQTAKDYFSRLLPDLHAGKLDKNHLICSLRKQLSTVPEATCLGDGRGRACSFSRAI